MEGVALIGLVLVDMTAPDSRSDNELGESHVAESRRFRPSVVL